MNIRLATVIIFLVLFSILNGCADDNDQNSEADSQNSDDDSGNGYEIITELSDPITIVPSSALPSEVMIQNANNNLDIVEHEGTLYFVFRTAPSHFASTETTLYVISSEDQINWTFEASFSYQTDLREPRFLSFNGRLFLYFSILGTNSIDFEPKGFMVSEFQEQGSWTKPEWVYEPGFIAWRTKVLNGIPYMLCYIGGENIYDFNAKPMEVHWLTTTDGRNWEPVISGQPTVLTGGGSETDFVFLDDGSLVAVSRNEEGDATGWGSKICRANAESLGDWECIHDPKKYDSPLLFKHGSHIFLIGRRNLTEDGNYDLGFYTLPPIIQTLLYEAAYWFERKRTTLWEIDPDSLKVSFVMDFPSKGDTCFPGMVQLSENEYLIFNYTSPLDGPDIFWLLGQVGPTSIYSTKLTIK